MRNRPAYLLLAVLAAACAGDRPIHPYQLDGFPGAQIVGGLFPLKADTRWTFEDRLSDPPRALELKIVRRGADLVLQGTKRGEVVVRATGEFLELVYEGKVLDRPLKLQGRVGDSWKVDDATYTAFGYDELEVLGKKRRALVVAVDRAPVRDLYWFVRGIGWARIRTEVQGAPKRDALLSEFQPGSAN